MVELPWFSNMPLESVFMGGQTACSGRYLDNEYWSGPATMLAQPIRLDQINNIMYVWLR